MAISEKDTTKFVKNNIGIYYTDVLFSIYPFKNGKFHDTVFFQSPMLM